METKFKQRAQNLNTEVSITSDAMQNYNH